MEDIELRVERMNAEVDSAHINKKALTGLLAGTVAPQVHGGAKEICVAFLSPPKEEDKESQFSPEEQAGLRHAMHKFLQTCQRALDANKKLSESDNEKEFQANLDAQFDQIRSAMQPLLADPSSGKKKAGASSKPKRVVHFG